MIKDKVILASASPRRKKMLEDCGIVFEIIPSDLLEIYPDTLSPIEIPVYLAEKKAESVKLKVKNKTIIAADTIVVLENEIFEKPVNESEAKLMLKKISGRSHDVITGVCIIDKHNKKHLFSETTKVFFKTLTDQEINHYIKNFTPFDKSGAYGVQEWIGLIAMERIEGSFYNVMGLPIHKVYEILSCIK